jgi:Zn-dependent protease
MLLRAIESGFDESTTKVLLAYVIAMVFAIALHEFAHAATAVWAGDNTPKVQGRLTLNPLAHLDPIGSLAILLVGFGWGKPVVVNPYIFRNVRRDMMLSAGAGPAMNLVLALLGAGLLHLAVFGLAANVIGGNFASTLMLLLLVWVHLNLSLMIFNLIPVGPLDGVKVLQWFMPTQTAERFYAFSMMYGGLLLIVLVIAMGRYPIVGDVIFWPVDQLQGLLLPRALVR